MQSLSRPGARCRMTSSRLKRRASQHQAILRMAKAAAMAQCSSSGHQRRTGCAAVAVCRLLRSRRPLSAAFHHAHDGDSRAGGRCSTRSALSLLDLRPETLATAHFLGVREFYRIGGAQAVAALAYGTATVPKSRQDCRARQSVCDRRKKACRL